VRCPEHEEIHSKWKFIHSHLLPCSVAEAHELVFLKEKFMEDVYLARKTTDYKPGPWAVDEESGCRKRTLTYLVAFPLGQSSVTDNQTQSKETREGQVYVVNSEVANEGVPFAASFLVETHVCLRRASDPDAGAVDADAAQWCLFTSYLNIKYIKPVWSMIKSQVDNNTYNGMVAAHQDITAALLQQAGRLPQASPRPAVVRRRKKRKTASRDYRNVKLEKAPDAEDRFSSVMNKVIPVVLFVSLILLVGVHVMLYLKITELEADRSGAAGEAQLQSKNYLPSAAADPAAWAALMHQLQQQHSQHAGEFSEVQHRLAAASATLGKLEEQLGGVLQELPGLQPGDHH